MNITSAEVTTTEGDSLSKAVRMSDDRPNSSFDAGERKYCSPQKPSNPKAPAKPQPRYSTRPGFSNSPTEIGTRMMSGSANAPSNMRKLVPSAAQRASPQRRAMPTPSAMLGRPSISATVRESTLVDA